MLPTLRSSFTFTEILCNKIGFFFGADFFSQKKKGAKGDTTGLPGFEPGSRAPEALVLSRLHYRPIWLLIIYGGFALA